MRDRGDPPAKKADPEVKRRYVLTCGGRWVADSDAGSLTERFDEAEAHAYESEAQLALQAILDAYETHDPPVWCELVRVEIKKLNRILTGPQDETSRGPYRVARSRKG